MLHRFIVCVVATLALSTPAAARVFHGVVTHVTDGDTLWVRPAGGGAAVQVRVQGIDAPEICQPSGVQARDALAARVLHQQVHVAVRAHDIYERTVGRVSLHGQDVGAWLVAGGHAWTSRYQRRAGPYAQEETAARDARRGLWAENSPLDPRLFRKRHGSCY